MPAVRYAKELHVSRLTFLSIAVLAVALTAAAADYPKRKAGLWEITRSPSNPKLPPQVQRICLDAETDALMYQYGEGASHKMCSKVDLHSSGGNLLIDSVCTLAQSQVSSHQVMSFSGDSAYHTDSTVHYDPPLFGKTSESHSTQDAKWLGACPADMKPGDIVTQASPMSPSPIRMNIRDMLKAGGPP
jgi:hypothetical protein